MSNKVKCATIQSAPSCLNSNDKSMWVTGWNECMAALEDQDDVKNNNDYAEGYEAAKKGIGRPIGMSDKWHEGYQVYLNEQFNIRRDL